MIKTKKPEEIEIIARAGKIAKGALDAAVAAVHPGVTTLEIDKIAEDYILSHGAKPGFKTVENYEFTTCININEGLVHGLPTSYKLQPGDLVSIDLGAYLEGWHSDLSHTVEVDTSEHKEFLEVGEKALQAGIEQIVIGNRLGDVGYAIQNVIESNGYTVSEDLVGHGLGRELHEDPYVPGYGMPGEGIEIKEGMVLAIEVIYQKGNPEIMVAEDDWTIVTADGSLSALFEHTVAVTKDGPRILTN